MPTSTISTPQEDLSQTWLSLDSLRRHCTGKKIGSGDCSPHAPASQCSTCHSVDWGCEWAWMGELGGPAVLEAAAMSLPPVHSPTNTQAMFRLGVL